MASNEIYTETELVSAAELTVLRSREGETRVSNAELFFDLVYAFAVTQLSHRLLVDLTVMGAA